jgi:hypothetical protein
VGGWMDGWMDGYVNLAQEITGRPMWKLEEVKIQSPTISATGIIPHKLACLQEKMLHAIQNSALYEGISKSFRTTGRLEQELQIVQL